MVDELIDNLYQNYLTKYYLRNYKKSGRKIIGILCNTVPEEVIHSCGAIPSRLIGSAIPSKIPSWICMYAKGVFESAMKGKFDYIDGIVSSTSDDTKIHLYSNMLFYMKPSIHYLIQLPYQKSEAGREFYKNEILRLCKKLIRSGLSEEKLNESISVYNRFRELLSEIDSMRAEEKPKISCVDWMKILLSSTAMSKDDINNHLSKIIEKAVDSEGKDDYRMRVHLSGNDFFNIEVVETIESMGFAVVSDDFCTAGGYYPGFVGKNLDGLVERYLSHSACNLASGNSLKERIEFIKSRIKSSDAEGIIVLRDRGCEVCGHQCPFILEEFKDMPVMVLDVDSGVSEQYQTRLEAFIEAYGD